MTQFPNFNDDTPKRTLKLMTIVLITLTTIGIILDKT